MKRISVMTAGLLMMTAIAFAGVDVKVNLGIPSPPPIPAPPQVRVVERETVVIKEKKDNGKHLGHKKHKNGKKKHKD